MSLPPPRPAREEPAPRALPYEALVEAGEPVVLRGACAAWPMVDAARRSDADALAYLRRFDAGRPVVCYRTAPDVAGRYFYDETVTALNFAAAREPLTAVLDEIEAALGDRSAPTLYVGSTDLAGFLPGFREDNPLDLSAPTFQHADPLVSLWFGGRTVASAHFDMSNNAAVCVAGRRRFTLFPPDQASNLYPGPLEPTPGGQVVSMVDFRAPDLSRFPRFETAWAHAVVAELEPGDMLVYPALWWHHVEGLADFNALVNVWWNRVPAHHDTPWTTLLHGLLSLRDRPPAEKEAWRALFDHYVFGEADRAGAHLPEAARGALASPLPPAQARRLRRQLIEKLNR